MEGPALAAVLVHPAALDGAVEVGTVNAIGNDPAADVPVGMEGISEVNAGRLWAPDMLTREDVLAHPDPEELAAGEGGSEVKSNWSKKDSDSVDGSGVGTGEGDLSIEVKRGVVRRANDDTSLEGWGRSSSSSETSIGWSSSLLFGTRTVFLTKVPEAKRVRIVAAVFISESLSLGRSSFSIFTARNEDVSYINRVIREKSHVLTVFFCGVGRAGFLPCDLTAE